MAITLGARLMAICLGPFNIREENRSCDPKAGGSASGIPPINLHCFMIVHEQTVRNCSMICFATSGIHTPPQTLANEILHHKSCPSIAFDTSDGRRPFWVWNSVQMAPTAEGRVEGSIPHHKNCSRMKNDGSISMDKRKHLTNISRSEKTNYPPASAYIHMQVPTTQRLLHWKQRN